MNRFLILFGLLALCTFAGRAADPELNLQGSGTQSDPWLITSQADFQALAKGCQNGTNGASSGHFDGKYFRQTADIDMSGVTDFYGIGTAPLNIASGTTYYFGGHYDGGNFRIKNLVINAVTFDDNGQFNTPAANKTRTTCGIFGDLKNGASVSNLIVDKSCEFHFYSYSGGIAGRVEAKSSITNCVNEADIYAYNNYIGGIAGYLYAATATQSATQIVNCVNKGNIYSVGQYAGGINGGGTYGIISGCVNIGNVIGKHFDTKANSVSVINQKYYGGIAGSASGVDVVYCWNSGTVEANSDFTGGLTGLCRVNSNLGKMENCITIGTVISGSINRKGIVTGQNGYGTGTSAPTYPMTLNVVYYDSQISAAMAPAVGNGEQSYVEGRSTAVLTGGTVPAGLSTQYFAAEAGFYPLPTLAKEDARIPAAAYFTIPGNANTLSFAGPAPVSTAVSGLSFTLAKNGVFSISNGNINIQANPGIAADTVYIRHNNTLIRPIPVEYWPENPFQGQGTQASPYLITNKDDVLALMKMVNVRSNHYRGAYFRQTADIDMQKDATFVGIGVGAGVGTTPETMFYFSGVYDGDGHVISNMVTNTNVVDGNGKALAVASGGYNNVGFFGALDSTAVIKNLNLDETCVVYGWQRVGGIAARMACGAVIDGCSFGGTIFAYQGYAGGIAGYMASPTDGTFPTAVRNSVFYGQVNCNHQYGGGIVGWSQSLIENCVSAGEVKNYLFNAATTLIGNTNNAGGITAYNGGEVRNCANFSNVHGHGSVGGIIGAINTYYHGGRTINNFNSGMVSCTAGQESLTGVMVGSMIATSNTENLEIKANYYDSQLATMAPFKGGEQTGIHGLSTDSLTTGMAVDSLGNGFEYVDGLYPLPKTLVNNEYARKAASVFFTLTYPQTLKTITSAAPINTKYQLTAKLARGNVFSIRDNRLVPGFTDEIVLDTLTLSIGRFYKTYPIAQQVANFLEGEGTAENPWKITSVRDMNRVADNAQANYVDYKGEYFVLTVDLDYAGATANPIGRVTPFGGHFDGQNHTIKNLTIGGMSNYIGLFGQTAATAVLENLKFTTSSVKARCYGGLLVGYNMGIIRNIVVDPSNKVEGVYDASASNHNAGTRGDYIGSIAGYTGQSGKIYNCENRGAVSGYFGAGGIVGYVGSASASSTDTLSIENCVNYGPITSTAFYITTVPGAYAGGITGYFYGKMRNCQNHGTITSAEGKYIGGLAGVLGNYSLIDSCFNYGTVTCQTDAAGGVCGFLPAASGTGKNSVIINSGNYGKITAYAEAGGICGHGSTRVDYINVFNKGKVTATNQGAGGIIGVSKNLKAYTYSITNSRNEAQISAPMKVGGIVGYSDENVQEAAISRCFNVGEIVQNIDPDSVNNPASCAAGIANGAVKISDCYNVANVKGWQQVGGIAGLVVNRDISSVANCYNLGDVTTENANTRLVGNVLGCLVVTASNSYTTNEYGHSYACDSRGGVKSVAPFALTQLELGSQWVSNQYCFPMLAGLDTLDVAKAYAAYFKTESDQADGRVNYPIQLSALPDVVWTANSLLKIEDGNATPIADGSATLTATCGQYSKTYLINVKEYGGAPVITADEIVDTLYYSLDGQRLTEPRKNAINVVIYITTDGRRVTTRQYIR